MKLKNNNFTREITSQIEQGENKELVFSICSEEPYLRQDETFGPYYQILEVTPEAINDERLRNGISFLKDHQSKSQLGIVKRWWIANKKLYVSVKFSRSGFAKAIKEDIEEGVRPWCSLGYYVDKFEKTGTAEDGIPILTAKRYTIYECSSVSVPADSTVGFNRELEIKEEKGTEMKNAQTDKTDTASTIDEQGVERKLEETDSCREDQATIVEDVETKSTEVEEVAEETKEEKELCPNCNKPLDECECEKAEEKACGENKPEEKQLEVTQTPVEDITYEDIAKEIRSLGDITNEVEVAKQFIAEKKSIEDFKSYLKTKNSEKKNNSIQKGSKMNKYFSISKAIRNACSQYKADVSQEYETLVNEENKRNFGVEDADIVLSNKELHQRALAPSAGVGAELINTDYLPQEFVTYLRPQLTLEKTGYYSIPVNGNPVSFAVCTSGSAAGMYDLDGELSAGDLKFALKTLAPKKAGVCIPVPYSLILQARPEIDAMVEADVVNALYQKRDEQILIGTGEDGQATGILNTPGINGLETLSAVSLSAGEAWGGMLSGVNEIRKANIFSEDLSFVMNGDTYVTLCKTMKDTNNCFAGFICEDDKIGKYPVFVNNAMPANTILVGDFTQVAVADFEGLKLKIDDITYIKKQAVQVIAIKAFDVAVRRTGAFTKIVLTA